jgi:uncharacterized pyridoxamine 5'-phosphate oxidase family protein
MQEVYEFLKKAQVYYLATVEKDRPRVRPFGTIDLFEGRLYILTVRAKGVSKQMGVNPNVELCASLGEAWIRVQAEVVEDPRREAKAHMLEAYPSLKDRYSAEAANSQVFYLKNAVATISTFTGEPKIIRF